MAAWVLPVFAGLCDRIDEPAAAREAREIAADLRDRVRGAWNGRWFDRAYAPGEVVVGGVDDLWLEVQPWAILCGAADPQQARDVLKAIDEGPRSASPPGRSPAVASGRRTQRSGGRGEGPGGGGIYPSVNLVLAWAARSVDPDFAMDEWHRMSLAQHEQSFRMHGREHSRVPIPITRLIFSAGRTCQVPVREVCRTSPSTIFTCTASPYWATYECWECTQRMKATGILKAAANGSAER